MGKSFEIRPTGVAHVDLLLPEEWEPKYPKSREPSHKGRVLEHFSWKKVITNVSGFILGSPTIDHYGDMMVCVASSLQTVPLSDVLVTGSEPQDWGSMRPNF
jgi:Oxysterol-binding protein